MIPPALVASPLLDGVEPEVVAALAAHLRIEEVPVGACIVNQGATAITFAVVLQGRARVERRLADGSARRLAEVGPGAVVGEVGLITRRPRTARVVASVPTTVARGDHDAFAILIDHPVVHDRLLSMARSRLAHDAEPVVLDLPGGGRIALRPLMVEDRDAMVAAMREASAETLRKRFLTGGMPTARMIDYLVNVDYVDHFAWVALDADDDGHPVAVGRYVRLRARHDAAEIAFTVLDAAQRRGVGTALLGALAPVAAAADITTFTASFRTDNAPMRRVLVKADADFSPEEPGVTHAEVAVAAAAALIPADRAERLRDTVIDLICTTA